MRVLAVDDLAAQREILRDQFQAWGFETNVAADGASALALLQSAAAANQPYHLALIDMVMPGINGTDLASEIKSDPALQRTTLLMLTSTDHPPDSAEIIAAGFAACLTKPLRQSELFNAVTTALAQTPSATNAATVSQNAGTAPRTANLSHDRILADLRQAQLRVLVAEDNLVNQEVAKDILGDAGCIVDLVSTGIAAVQAVEKTHYDLALMDCQMPEMDGFEAVRRIRDAESHRPSGTRALPIIALTANAIQGDRERCLRSGMNDYVTKPVDPETLYQTIHSLIQKTMKPATPINSAPTETAANDLPQPIDLDSLLRRCNGKSQLVEKLLGKFETSLKTQLQEMRSQIDRADSQAISRLAHSIKGASANLSAAAVTAAAAKLEKLGAAGDLASIEACVEQFENSVKECIDYLPTVVACLNERNPASANLQK
jgi:CheY-like chemotaxis protein/HPt (histidine-containing phosphotransfer) domain-containing protein